MDLKGLHSVSVSGLCDFNGRICHNFGLEVLFSLFLKFEKGKKL